MNDYITKGNEYADQANRIMLFSLRTLFISDKKKVDRAIVLLDQAKNMYKLAQEWKLAIDIIHRRIVLIKDNYDNQDIPYNMIRKEIYIELFELYQKYDIYKAIEYMRDIIENVFIAYNDTYNASKYNVILGDIFMNDLGDINNAIVYYMKAYVLSKNESIELPDRIVLLLCESKRYHDAVLMLDNIINICIKINAYNYNVNKYIYYQLLCKLCMGDITMSRELLKHYCNTVISFGHSHECMCITDIIHACVQMDTKLYQKTIFKYYNHVTLADFHYELLDAIKNNIND